MKHLIETANPSGLTKVDYDRIVLDSTKNDVIVRGGYEYVDLGLPRGLKWAKCNVGAEKESDYGYYFQWGSTSPNTANECTWANAPFNGRANDYNSTYFNEVKDTVCPNGILAKKYDAAAQIMGGDWRMPTNIEFQELCNNTTQSWVTINGVNGRKFTGPNGNSIFIPAAGGCGDGSTYEVGDYGNVWSSSLVTSGRNAFHLYFGSNFSDVYNTYRYYGKSVRGVRN